MCSACLMHCIDVRVHSCSSHSLQILEKAAEIVGASDCASLVSECVAGGSLVLLLTVILFNILSFLSKCAVNKVIVHNVLLSHSVRAHTLLRICFATCKTTNKSEQL